MATGDGSKTNASSGGKPAAEPGSVLDPKPLQKAAVQFGPTKSAPGSRLKTRK